MSAETVTSIVLAGLGGQGIVTASDILAGALHRQGYDVKKSEIHGMSQRGGSVSSDIRFGQKVFSPMVPSGGADYLVIMEPTQVEPNRHLLNPVTGVLITPTDVAYVNTEADDDGVIDSRAAKVLNVALLGVLSAYLEVTDTCWQDAMKAILPASVQAMNVEVFTRARAVERMARVVKEASTPQRRK